MKKVGIVKDERYMNHQMGAQHPESPKRLEAIYAMLEEPDMNILGEEAETIILADIGQHTVTLVVDDGHASASASATFEVITAGVAVEVLILQVEDSALARNSKRPLNATLKAAVASFDRGRFNAGLNQLKAFQNKVKAQVVPFDAELGVQLIHTFQQITDALTEQPE